MEKRNGLHEKDRHNILYGSVKYRGGLSDCITICGIYTSWQMVSERWQKILKNCGKCAAEGYAEGGGIWYPAGSILSGVATAP